jgi:hypothetical protein
MTVLPVSFRFFVFDFASSVSVYCEIIAVLSNLGSEFTEVLAQSRRRHWHPSWQILSDLRRVLAMH